MADMLNQGSISGGADKALKLSAMSRLIGQQPQTVSNDQDVPETFSVIKPTTTPPIQSPSAQAPSEGFTSYLTSKQGMIDTVLPVMAAIETIATQGKSPGTTALGQQDFLIRQQQSDAQAKRDALAAAVGEKKQKQEEDYKSAIQGIKLDDPNAQKQLVQTIAAYGSPADAASLLERQISQGGKQVAPLTDAEKVYVDQNSDLFPGGSDVWANNPANVRASMAAAAKAVATASGLGGAGYKQTVDEADAAKAADESRRAALHLAGAVRGGAGGAARGPGAVAIARLQTNKDWSTQNNKVSSALHAMNLIDQATRPDGTMDINQMTSPELAMTMANLISGGNSHTVEEFRSMNPPSLGKNIAELSGQLLNRPVPVLSQEWAQQIKQTIGRQGAMSQKIRDKSGYQGSIYNAVSAGQHVAPEDSVRIMSSLNNYGPKFTDAYPEYLPDFASEQAARAAGYGNGEKVKIGGVAGTLH